MSQSNSSLLPKGDGSHPNPWPKFLPPPLVGMRGTGLLSEQKQWAGFAISVGKWARESISAGSGDHKASATDHSSPFCTCFSGATSPHAERQSPQGVTRFNTPCAVCGCQVPVLTGDTQGRSLSLPFQHKGDDICYCKPRHAKRIALL